uniref:NAB domain-containing protein n=1 Tax=Davidia involucrata TaxID=16924 RepID=A0A5B7AFJ8_DAVIN
MTSSLVKSNKYMKRMESKKSHCWWWDSHISPKNSKWLAENLEEMDQCVKRMLTLIEEDGDSFAKKAEMYYQKRPELISRVEEFYRMYRSLAERYDHVTGELRKNIPSDLQSQGSGISDIGSEPVSTWPSPDQRLSRRKSGPRAAGFDFFLGAGGNSSDLCNKEGDESSTLDSESESDDSSVNNYSGSCISGNDDDQGLRRKIIELEVELRNLKEKLRVQQEDNADASFRGNSEELKMTKEELEGSEKEVANLKHDNASSIPIRGLQDQLGLAQNDVATWKAKLDKEKREVSKLQDRIARYKANLSDRDQEIRRLKETISNANQSLSEENSQLQVEISRLLKERTYLEDNLKEWELRCQSLEEEIRRVKAGKIEMEGMLGAEIEQLKAGISERDDRVDELNKSIDAFELKYDTLMAERDELNAKIVAHIAELSCRDDRIDQMTKHLHQLHMEHVELIAGTEGAHRLVEELRSRVKEVEEEVERQRVVILEGAEEKREVIRQLCFSLEHYRNGYHQLRQAFIGHKRLPIMAS